MRHMINDVLVIKEQQKYRHYTKTVFTLLSECGQDKQINGLKLN